MAGRHALRCIFVNYRRNDSEGEAGRLFDYLSARFGHEAVFMDVAAIELGRDFRKAIDQKLAYRNAVELTHARWKSDLQVLIDAVLPHMEQQREGPATKPAVESTKAPERGNPAMSGRSSMSGCSAMMGTMTGLQAVGPQTLDRISRELATYIGPIADLIVKQTAKRCSSIDELCTRIAKEIEGDTNRANFLRACR